MSRRVFLAEWNPASARSRAAELRAHGWQVEWEAEDGWRAYSSIRRQPPDAVVIDLAHKPAHGRELGRSLRYGMALRDLPLLFVDGDAHNRELARKAVDGAVFTRSQTLGHALAGVAARHARHAECAWLALPV
jgi:DNA-binding response OmpR family regulator